MLDRYHINYITKTGEYREEDTNNRQQYLDMMTILSKNKAKHVGFETPDVQDELTKVEKSK